MQKISAMDMPIFKKRSLWAEILQIFLLILSILACYKLIGEADFRYSLISGVLLYFLLTWFIPSFFINSFQKSVNACISKDYETAVENLKKSYKFFSKYPWIDKWRYILLGNTSSLSFKFLILNNLVFCYKQLHNEQKATYYMDIIEKTYPEK